MVQEWCTLVKMGQLFGLTAQQLGSKLKAMGLRDPDGQPSQAAQDAQLVGLTSKMVQGMKHMWVPTGPGRLFARGGPAHVARQGVGSSVRRPRLTNI